MADPAHDQTPDPITKGKLLGSAELVSLADFAAKRAEKLGKTIDTLSAGIEARAAEVANSLASAGFDARAQADAAAKARAKARVTAASRQATAPSCRPSFALRIRRCSLGQTRWNRTAGPPRPLSPGSRHSMVCPPRRLARCSACSRTAPGAAPSGVTRPASPARRSAWASAASARPWPCPSASSVQPRQR